MAKISRRKVADVIVDQLIAGKKPKAIAQELAAFIVDKHMEKQFDQLINDIAIRLQEVTAHVDVSVTTASPLTDAGRDELKKFILSEFKAKSVEIQEQQDPSLLGGFLLQTPEYEYDASVRYQLNQLANTQGDK